MFVVIEGGECSGKSTLIDLLKLQYTNAIYTRGLGGSSVGEKD
jgi:Thymidylate kinase